MILTTHNTQQIAFWGTGVFEALDAGSTYRSHASFESNPPTLTLEGQQTYTSWPVMVKFPENHPGVPFHVHAEFQDNSTSYALKVCCVCVCVYVCVCMCVCVYFHRIDRASMTLLLCNSTQKQKHNKKL